MSQFRAFAEKAERPLIFFDDDGDGTTAFTMLYRSIGKGNGVPVKNGPEVTDFFLRKVEEYQPDIIFVLDKPLVSDVFIDGVSVPIVWLDHHAPQEHKQEHVHYFNPRVADDDDARCTSYWMYHFIGKPEDSWIGLTGVIADWNMPDFLEELEERFPELLPDERAFKNYYLHPTLGILVRLMTFMQKGTVKESMQAIKTFTRIEHPKEILKQTTPRGKFLWRRYQQYAQEYDALLERALQLDKKGLLVFEYEATTSFTKELSNELLLSTDADIIIVARKHEGFCKASFRSKEVNIVDRLQEALKGLRGNVGGHSQACGGKINLHDWKTFIDRFAKSLDTP